MRAGKNVIFHRVPEERSDKVEERKDSDLIFVTELHGVFNIKLREKCRMILKKMFRLGRWSPEKKSSSACYFQRIGNERHYHMKSQKYSGIQLRSSEVWEFPLTSTLMNEKTSER